MIKPTIGRVVWFREVQEEAAQPKSALICFVHSDTEVNLAVFDHNGNPFSMRKVTLYQGEGPRPEGIFAEWMPYQIGQAAKVT